MSGERANLKRIKKMCGGSAPDMLDHIFVTWMSDIDEAAMPAMDSNTTRIPNIPLKAAVGNEPAGKWERWEVARTDNSYDAGRKDSGYAPKFEYFIEKMDEVKSFILSKARCEKLAVVGIDNNGKMKYMDNADIHYDESTKGKNGYKIEFTCGPRPDPLPFVTGDFPTNP